MKILFDSNLWISFMIGKRLSSLVGQTSVTQRISISCQWLKVSLWITLSAATVT